MSGLIPIELIEAMKILNSDKAKRIYFYNESEKSYDRVVDYSWTFNRGNSRELKKVALFITNDPM